MSQLEMKAMAKSAAMAIMVLLYKVGGGVYGAIFRDVQQFLNGDGFCGNQTIQRAFVRAEGLLKGAGGN